MHGGVRVVEDVHGKARLRFPREGLDRAVAFDRDRWIRAGTQRIEFCSNRARSV